MGTHPQITGIKALIRLGQVWSFEDIFNKHGFPHTPLATELRTNNNRMRDLIRNPEGLNGKEIKRIAEYFDVPLITMGELIFRQIESQQ